MATRAREGTRWGVGEPNGFELSIRIAREEGTTDARGLVRDGGVVVMRDDANETTDARRSLSRA